MSENEQLINNKQENLNKKLASEDTLNELNTQYDQLINSSKHQKSSVSVKIN